MITARDVIPITLTADDLALCQHYATTTVGFVRAGAMQGVSHIRDNANGERQQTLLSDNVTGQAGMLAAHVYLFGRPLGVQLYTDLREQQDRQPMTGDGGQDIAGRNVDVKTSLRRDGRRISKHHLIVRPAEFHAGWVYWHALFDPPVVYLTGWARSTAFGPPQTEGLFAGARVIPVPRLWPLVPMVMVGSN